MLSFADIATISWILAAISLIFFIYKSDEVPLILTLLYFASGLYRYYIVVVNPDNLRVGWVRVAYAREIFDQSDELALVALNYFLLGTCTWVLSYIAFRLIFGKQNQKIDLEAAFGSFLHSRRKLITTLYGIIVIATFYLYRSIGARINSEEGFNLGGISYALYLPFALGGIVILVFVLFKNIGNRIDPTRKMVYLGLLLLACFQTYNPGARFGFISWTFPVIFILLKDKSSTYKLLVYGILSTFGVLLFAIAGLSRTPGALNLPLEAQVTLALDRIKSAEDQNLLDGFMMVLQVYPDHLAFQNGFQHLEILLRPIPRSLWPEKPVGGYANKLGLNDTEGNSLGMTVGISESIYGTFYGEGGPAAIVYLSMLYGLLFAVIIQRAEKYRSELRFIIKGCLISSTTAIIRGGDLAGIFAFIGMSYWPIFVATLQYGSYMKRFNVWYEETLLAKRFALLNQAQAALKRVSENTPQ